MSLPHNKIKTKGYPITIKSNPDKSEIQTRIELLKKNGYKIDQSKVKSWGPNLQKMWSKISSKYITLDGRPYTAPVNNNDVTYMRYDFIPFDKYRNPKREIEQSDFVRLSNQLRYVQTPFTNTTLVDDREKKYQVTDAGRSRFVTFPSNKNNTETEEAEFRTEPRDQAYRENHEEIFKNTFYNDLADRNNFRYYDFNDYPITTAQSTKTKSTKSVNDEYPEQKAKAQSEGQEGQKTKSFTDAFNDARKNKLQFFTYNGKLYHSMTKQELNGSNSEWSKFKNNSKELGQSIDSKININSVMMPTIEQDKQRTGTTGQISQLETTSAPLRYYNNEFEQASNYANQATNAGKSTKTIAGEWQPVLPEADRADFETDEEYKQGYINKQQDNTSQNAEDGNYAFSYLRAQNEKDGGKLRKKLISKIK